MIISVASGKGGTGKTTISTNLALAMEGEVTLLDCDVEEPNAHLFIQPNCDEQRTVTTFVPEIVEDNCNGCRKCVEICRFNALTVVGGTAMVFPELCHSCTGCKLVCPEKAIIDGSRELGVIEFGSQDNLKLIHGCLRIGEAMAPPLIKAVKNSVQNEKSLIIDAPPGTSCPVIAAVKDSDFVLLVTEPTPFGLHDLKLAVGAVRQLGIPCGLLINRADLGNDDVHRYAKEVKLPILLEIPFDRGIAELYASGKILVAERPEWRETFCQLYKEIGRLVAGEREDS